MFSSRNVQKCAHALTVSAGRKKCKMFLWTCKTILFICLFAFLNLFLLLRCESAFVLWNFNLQMFQSIARKALRKNFDFLLQFFVPAFFHYHLVEVHWSLKSERGISWVHTVHSKFTYISILKQFFGKLVPENHR